MFSRLEKCRVQFQSPLGHGGSIVFQSIFDGHPEVLMFPAPTPFYSTFYDENGLENRWEKAMEAFLDHQYYVSPSVSGLGPKGDERLANQSKLIVEITGKHLCRRPFSRRNLFFAFYEAVADVYDQDLDRVRLIWCHEHDLMALLEAGLPAAKADGLSFRLVVNTRDPRSQWLSVLNSIRKELGKGPNAELLRPGRNQLYTNSFQCMVLGAQRVEETPFSYDIVRLEELQRQRYAFAQHYAEKLGLSPHPALNTTTFLGKRFSGSWYAGVADGISTTALWENWIPNFVGIEAAAVERALAPEIEALGYAPPWATGRSWLSSLFLPLSFLETNELRAARWKRAKGIAAKILLLYQEIINGLGHGYRMFRVQLGKRRYSRLPSVSPIGKMR